MEEPVLEKLEESRLLETSWKRWQEKRKEQLRSQPVEIDLVKLKSPALIHCLFFFFLTLIFAWVFVWIFSISGQQEVVVGRERLTATTWKLSPSARKEEEL